MHLYLTSAIFHSIYNKLKSLSIEALYENKIQAYRPIVRVFGYLNPQSDVVFVGLEGLLIDARDASKIDLTFYYIILFIYYK